MFRHSSLSQVPKWDKLCIFDGKYRKYKHSKTENLSLSQKREMVLTDVTTVKYDEWGEI